MPQFAPVAEQLEYIKKGVAEVIRESELAERLEKSRQSGKPLRVYAGFDPTGRDATRPPLSREQIAANAETYKQQVFKILDAQKTEVRNNSEWLHQLGFEGMVRLAAKYTVSQMLERDAFHKRFQDETPI